jgi:hypothetical protein
MGKGLRLCLNARHGSTLAVWILAFRALSPDLAIILLGTSAAAVAFHISHETTTSLQEEIIPLLREEEDLRREIEAAMYRTSRRLEISRRRRQMIY